PFLGLRDNPWTTNFFGEADDANACVLRYRDGGEGFGFFPEEDEVSACSVPRSEVYSPVDPAATILAAYPQAVAVDTANWFCTAASCPPIIGNIPVYRDQNHISNAYSRSTRDLLWEHLGPVLGR
ncbi:MAG TPA: SGNH hydrolase domain-containing protein, partial [Corynebacterium sp.]|nr:SGNH hydrolase domain-containing protein [Corynebacterium sp.]